MFDQLAMRRFARATYALMVVLLSATVTVIGILVRPNIPTPTDILGVALIIIALATQHGHGPLTTHPRGVRASATGPAGR